MAANQASDHLQNPSNPYFLHPNENAAFVLVSPVLTGSNYHLWARLMQMALAFRIRSSSLMVPPSPIRIDANALPGTVYYNAVILDHHIFVHLQFHNMFFGLINLLMYGII